MVWEFFGVPLLYAGFVGFGVSATGFAVTEVRGFVMCRPAGGSLHDTYFFYCFPLLFVGLFLYLYLVVIWVGR